MKSSKGLAFKASCKSARSHHHKELETSHSEAVAGGGEHSGGGENHGEGFPQTLLKPKNRCAKLEIMMVHVTQLEVEETNMRLKSGTTGSDVTYAQV